jgi:uncharacterized membrane protein
MKTCSWRSEWAPISILAAMLAASAWSWPHVPARMPVHWDLQGQPDRHGGRIEGLLVLPLAAIAIYLLFLVLPRFDPGRDNYPRFRGAYLTIRLAILLVIAALHAALLASAQGIEIPIDKAMTGLIAALFIAIGLVMGKLRPNWFVGIRTPWTLSSKLAWTRSHSLGGWLFTALGIAALAILAVDRAAALLVLLAGGGALAITVVGYSYIVWRSDPNRVPPAGTSPSEDA